MTSWGFFQCCIRTELCVRLLAQVYDAWSVQTDKSKVDTKWIKLVSILICCCVKGEIATTAGRKKENLLSFLRDTSCVMLWYLQKLICPVSNLIIYYQAYMLSKAYICYKHHKKSFEVYVYLVKVIIRHELHAPYPLSAIFVVFMTINIFINKLAGSNSRLKSTWNQNWAYLLPGLTTDKFFDS